MPISAFARALRAFQSGDLSPDELSWEIDRQLAIDKASPLALLEVLKAQQASLPLSAEAHAAIVDHLELWPRDPTIITGHREPRLVKTSGVGIGDILQGRFSLVALIGQGGMSRVYKAIDLRRVEAGAADPYVAVKVLTEPLSEYFGSIVALQREAHKLQSLSHPNIVRVIDCDRDDETVFMTMEYLAGESLQKRLRARKEREIDQPAALALIAAVGDALEYAHRNHIVHGDLKPGNILLTDRGDVKVIDFGMARFVARPGEPTALQPTIEVTPKAVTPRYASPAMVAGHEPEPADDVYALACIAYEVLSGNHPFGRSSAVDRDPKLVPSRPPGMARHQYRALLAALAFDRRQRTATMRQFLAQFLGNQRRTDLQRWAAVAVFAVIAIGAALYWSPGLHGPGNRAIGVAAAAAGPLMQDCPLCPAMKVLPAGTFQQGSNETAGEAAVTEAPAHQVAIAHAFAMSVDEVTVAQFREFVTDTNREMNGCSIYDERWQLHPDANWLSPGFVQEVTHPVTCVSWEDASAYAAWLSGKTSHRYRLPTASEWEYAARAGTEATRPWGDDQSAACADANVADSSAAQRYPGWVAFACNDHFVNTAPVGSFKANAFGIQDLLGNVAEWVQDCWHDTYQGAPVDGSAWMQGDCIEHELRGGSWFTTPRYVTATFRNRFGGSYRSSATGIRLVREIDQ